MKKLLLSLTGIVATTSSGIIPVAMSSNTEQIKTVTPEETKTPFYDISNVKNSPDNPYTKVNLEFQTMHDFENKIAPLAASKILKNLNYSIEPEWLLIKESTWLETNTAVNQSLLDGEFGSGQYNIEIIIEASQLGIENNVIGEMTFYMTLNFKNADLE